MFRTTFIISVALIGLLLVQLPLVIAQQDSVLPPQPSSRTSIQSNEGPKDTGWPRGYSLPSEAQVVLFQPQVATWENQKHMVALAAVQYVVKDEKKPTLGTIKFEADTEVSLE